MIPSTPTDALRTLAILTALGGAVAVSWLVIDRLKAEL